ncbi:MAG: NAD(P)H-dependent oxidoreductase subunit E, partial [Proteobacteria bacterium]|nr:NAD(P)H-dependent oxidoreductase subunit E [Pseudomonadota bacterium]
MEAADLKAIVASHIGRKGGLMTILEQIQSKYGYLPSDALQVVSQETGRSMVDIYGVATFYKAFSLTPKGKHLVSVCLGTACHVRAAPGVA